MHKLMNVQSSRLGSKRTDSTSLTMLQWQIPNSRWCLWVANLSRSRRATSMQFNFACKGGAHCYHLCPAETIPHCGLSAWHLWTAWQRAGQILLAKQTHKLTCSKMLLIKSWKKQRQSDSALQQFGNSMSEIDTYQRFLTVQSWGTRKRGTAYAKPPSIVACTAFGHCILGWSQLKTSTL